MGNVPDINKSDLFLPVFIVHNLKTHMKLKNYRVRLKIGRCTYIPLFKEHKI